MLGTGVEPARDFTPTSTSSWRVCQFRHPSVWGEAGRIIATLRQLANRPLFREFRRADLSPRRQKDRRKDRKKFFTAKTRRSQRQGRGKAASEKTSQIRVFFAASRLCVSQWVISFTQKAQSRKGQKKKRAESPPLSCLSALAFASFAPFAVKNPPRGFVKTLDSPPARCNSSFNMRPSPRYFGFNWFTRQNAAAGML